MIEKVLVLKKNVDVDAFFQNNENVINYGFAEYFSEKSRLEDVLSRQVEDERHEFSAELVEIRGTTAHCLCIIDPDGFDYSEFFEGVDEDGEKIKDNFF